MRIRIYRKEDEEGWLRCRVLAFLHTAYFDNVLTEKETYDHPSLELVAEENGQIIGILDIEYEVNEGTVCSRGSGRGGMIWHLAVHPDFQRKAIGRRLLEEVESQARELGLNRLEAWTRDDVRVNQWYEKNGFVKVDGYLHVYIDGEQEIESALLSGDPNLRPVHAFAHYVGEDKERIIKSFKRVHECRCYEKKLG